MALFLETPQQLFPTQIKKKKKRKRVVPSVLGLCGLGVGMGDDSTYMYSNWSFCVMC